MRSLVAAPVFTLLLLHVVVGFFWIGGAALRSPRRGRVAAARWSRALLRLLGVRWRVEGAPCRGALLVANHLSWLDIVVLKATVAGSFLSKAELRRWPLVGPVAQRLGTLFIGRGQSGAAERATVEMAQRLREGDAVIFFPEGAITQQLGLMPFRPRLFRAAVDAQTQVQPVALCYGSEAGDLGDSGDLGALIPERTLLGSVWWVAGRRGVHIAVRFLEPLAVEGRSRRELADEARGAIAAATGLPALGTIPPIRGSVP
ncbi:1-acyl-sn-glycerol-3-phosphate acyltransferase [Halorhodospira abdelmalekii]|uniref:1-acyl-sn-glycerol-3-phosphate acyltransferase n=1 Tax=Halorhodospira abdelmalekii TaxID=421629 RepID=UPI0019081CF3